MKANTARATTTSDRPVSRSLFTAPGPMKSWLTAVLPASALLIAAGAAEPVISVPAGVCAFVLGILQWSFLEYAIHRWLYHSASRHPMLSMLDSLHRHHHTTMDDPQVINAGPLLVYPVLLVVATADWLLSGMHLGFSAMLVLGTVWAYAFYEWVHFRIHWRPESRGYLSWIQKYHLYHHYRAWSRCNGNTSSLWDHVFGTYDPRYRQFDAASAPREHFHSRIESL